MSGRWANSTRNSELPPDWAKRRADVKRRAGGRCEAEQHEPECRGIGHECDHIGDKHDHRLTNLRWLSTPCHKARTQQQAKDARVTQARPPEQHPGLL